MLTSCELLLLYIRTSVLSWITNICRSISQTAAKRAWSPKVAVDRIVTESVVATKQLARYQDDAHAGGADRCDLYKIKYDFCLLQYKMRNMKQCFLYSNWSGALHAHNIIAYILNNSHLHSYSESHNIPINQITSGKWSDRELGARRDCTLFFALNKPNHCSIPAQCYIILYMCWCVHARSWQTMRNFNLHVLRAAYVALVYIPPTAENPRKKCTLGEHCCTFCAPTAYSGESPHAVDNINANLSPTYCRRSRALVYISCLCRR